MCAEWPVRCTLGAKAVDNGGLRYGAMESALRPPLPTATQAIPETQIQGRLTCGSGQNIIASIRGSRRQVAEIKSEPRPASNRNRWPASYWNAWPASSESARQLPITNFAHKTGIVGDASLAAILAALDMSAERRRPAGLDRRHDLALIEGEPMAPRSAKTVAMAAEDVRHLKFRAHVAPRYSGGTTASESRSKGLGVLAIKWVATCA